MPTLQNIINNAHKAIVEVDINDSKKMLADDCVKVIDVRGAEEFNQGHLPNTINIPRGVLEFQIADNVSQKITPILIYSNTGKRAALAAQTLHQLGYQNVKSISGGLDAWKACGMPVINPQETRFY